MPKVRLTQQDLKAPLRCPTEKGRIEYCDLAVPGLYLEVRANNSDVGTLYLRYRNTLNKTAHTKLGTTQELTLKAARERAKALKAQIALGIDPQAAARQQQAIPTWDRFFADDYLPHVKAVKRTWKNDADMHNNRISAAIGPVRLDQLSRAQIEAFHRSLPSTANIAESTADHHLKLIRHALNLAVDWDIIPTNPAARIKQFNPDNQIERYLSEEELGQLIQVLRDHENRPTACVVLWLLATGCRVGEALAARWSDIDEPHRVWTITAATAKSKRRHQVKLSDFALSVLSELKALKVSREASGKPKDDHLFVGRRGPIQHMNKNWERIRTLAGLEDVRMHDLRHNYASMLVNAGFTLYDVQHALGHSDPKVTMRYAHLSDGKRQEAANTAGDILAEALRKAS